MSGMEEHEALQRMTAMEIAFATLAATLGTKLDTLTLAVGSQHGDHETRIRALEHRVDSSGVDHEGRLRKLERAMWIVSGTAGTGGGALGAFLAAVLGIGA